MTTDSLVLDVLRDLEIDVTGVDETTRLREDLQIDSTELVEVAVAIEDSTAIRMDTDEVLALKTIGDLIAYVANAPARA